MLISCVQTQHFIEQTIIQASLECIYFLQIPTDGKTEWVVWIPKIIALPNYVNKHF